MTPQKTDQNTNKIHLIKDIYKQTLIDINNIRKERDKKIKNILKNIDKKHAGKILQDIKQLK